MSKFTEFDANKLHRLYRRALSKRHGDTKKYSEVSSHVLNDVSKCSVLEFLLFGKHLFCFLSLGCCGLSKRKLFLIVFSMCL